MTYRVTTPKVDAPAYQHIVDPDGAVVAKVFDKDQAQRIVDLLNASDEKRKDLGRGAA